MDQPLSKKLVIGSLLEAGGALRTIMADIAARGYSDNACFGIHLALDEAVSNAIRHGNRSDPTKHVTIEYRVTDEEVNLKVCDEGPGFRPNCVPDPTLDENIERPNGRGVMLMRAYMTEVHYNDCGNCVTLVKRRNCPLPWQAEP
jgi:serine/threonine-protein kinase RsbW